MSHFVLPPGAALILGYSENHMRNLHEHGVLKHLVHLAGCTAYYIFPELLIFKRQTLRDAELAALIEMLRPEDEKE